MNINSKAATASAVTVSAIGLILYAVYLLTQAGYSYYIYIACMGLQSMSLLYAFYIIFNWKFKE